MHTTCSLTMVWKKGKKAKENLKNAKKYKKMPKKMQKNAKKNWGVSIRPPRSRSPWEQTPVPPEQEQTPLSGADTPLWTESHTPVKT